MSRGVSYSSCPNDGVDWIVDFGGETTEGVKMHPQTGYWFGISKGMSKVLENQDRILKAIGRLAKDSERSIPVRFLGVKEAARYCGFPASDRQNRGFLKFVEAERIRFKYGNTYAQKLFDIVELNRAMTNKTNKI